MDQPHPEGDPAPTLELENYFAGRTRAWGIFEDSLGRLRRQFTVELSGRVEAGGLTLEERFLYADGTRERRIWRIRRTGPGRYEGKADDVDGVATGTVAGNVLDWRYVLRLPIGGRTWRIAFADRMVLLPDGVLINRARASKWGVPVGTLSVAFARQPSAVVNAAAFDG
ncbi:MAG: DUF3833 family protein [Rhodospirillales bacterium]